MKQVKIYQIQFSRDCEYSFMGWEYAKDKFSMDDYKLVATYTDEGDDDSILNTAWNCGNNGLLQQSFPEMYSVSVSNIIEIDNTKYYVDSFGFKEVE